MATEARFRLARVLVVLALLAGLAGTYGLSRTHDAHRERSYVIDAAAWGSRQPSKSGEWFVLGPEGHPTSRIGFEAAWTALRVEDHQAFRAPFAPAGRVDDCQTTFETEGLRVTAYSCRGGPVYVKVHNHLDQPRVVLIEGRGQP